MDRIAGTFGALRSRGEAALIPYLMTGYPSLKGTRELLCALAEAGADAVELGVPFSDPLADGATLQRVSHHALINGVGLRQVLELVAEIRAQISCPLILMSYYNPLLSLGDEAFVRAAVTVGVDGIIVPDLPVEEAGPLGAACGAWDLALVGMVAPTSPDERVGAIARRASGFVYGVSVTGVTGARARLADGVDQLVERVRRVTELPVVVGFGISSAEQVRRVTTFADGVIVASALLDRLEEASATRRAQIAGRFVSELKGACRRGRPPCRGSV